jgi:GNAT superfamily N-acetyltransferase
MPSPGKIWYARIAVLHRLSAAHAGRENIVAARTPLAAHDPATFYSETMTDIAVRPMLPSELPFAASLTLGEGWHSETLEEFEGFFARHPAGCLIAERTGRPLGIGVATAYGDAGFLGQIVVCPEARGQGVGERIVGALVGCLERAGVTGICLDATAAGAPLYERHGFLRVQTSLRFAGTLHGAAHPHVRPLREADLDAVCALDRDWWGADRGFFIRRRRHLHPGLCHVLERDVGQGVSGATASATRAASRHKTGRHSRT